MKNLNKDYWDQRYIENMTGWDIGHISTPLKAYVDQLDNKDLQILIPGAGNAYEAAYLHAHDFSNVHIVDIAPTVIASFEYQHPTFPKKHIHLQNFFDHSGLYDIILEQTFFCALEPRLRNRYVDKCQELLKPGGQIAGVMFGVNFERQGPPFGGIKAEYSILFSKHFTIKTLEDCYNSITPRSGSELFVQFVNK